jgi:hypothetical protein
MLCIYIVGEGPKRPQHRDHPWSIVDYVKFSLCDISFASRWYLSSDMESHTLYRIALTVYMILKTDSNSIKLHSDVASSRVAKVDF